MAKNNILTTFTHVVQRSQSLGLKSFKKFAEKNCLWDRYVLVVKLNKCEKRYYPLYDLSESDRQFVVKSLKNFHVLKVEHTMEKDIIYLVY